MRQQLLIFSMALLVSLSACGSATQSEAEMEAGAAAEGTADRQSTEVEPSTPPEPKTAVVAAGTVLEVRLTRGISSGTNQTGDEFESLLERDLTIDGTIVIPRGSTVTGRLLDVKGSAKVKGRAEMTLVLTEIAVGEEQYPVQTDPISIQAEGTKGRDTAVIGGAAGVGALIGGIVGGKKGAAIGAATGGGAGTAGVLMTKGKEVELSPEQQFSFRLQQDLEVKLSAE